METLNIIGARPYEEVREDCHALKAGITSRNPVMVRCATRIAPAIRRAFLIPVPSHHGPATDTLQLTLAIADEINRAGGTALVADVLEADPHASLCEAKHTPGADPSAIEVRVHLRQVPVANIIRKGPKIPVYLVDNVVDTGRTARACMAAVRTDGILAVGDTGAWMNDLEKEKP